MADDLFADTGPEGRNRDSQKFERQLRRLSDTLGWKVLDCNVDVWLSDDQKDAAGVDLIIAYRDPQHSHQNDGWLLEGKRHDGPGRYTSKQIGDEVQRLRKKVASLDGKKRFTEHERVRPHVDRLVGGVLAHYSADYDAAKARNALEGMTLSGHSFGVDPLRIAYLGPDTLNGLAEAFDLTGDPNEFLWPVSMNAEQKWSPVCPPDQLAAGLLAWRTGTQTVMWLRDTLEHADIPALERIARVWGISFDLVVVTELTQEKLARLRATWEEVASDSQKDQGPGQLPKEIRALELTNANMREFNKRWPDAE